MKAIEIYYDMESLTLEEATILYPKAFDESDGTSPSSPLAGSMFGVAPQQLKYGVYEGVLFAFATTEVLRVELQARLPHWSWNEEKRQWNYLGAT
jgi:hypothetical protein